MFLAGGDEIAVKQLVGLSGPDSLEAEIYPGCETIRNENAWR